MNDKDLIASLKQLQNLQPDSDWLKANGSVLRSQLYSGSDEAYNLGFWAKFNLTMSRLSEPYAVAAMIMLFFLGSGFFSYLFGRNSKPGEPLYVAKMVGERTKYAMTFNDEAKTKLNVEFAKARVEEISQVVDAPIDERAKAPKVAALKDDFKKEVAAARQKLAKAAPRVDSKAAESAKPQASSSPAKPEGGKDNGYMTAGTAKDGERLDIAVPESQRAEAANAGQALDAAEQLFDQADYQAAKEALDKANALIEQEK